MRLKPSLMMATGILALFSLTLLIAADKPKVFVSGGNSFQVNSSKEEASVSGTADATAAEGIKLFRSHCLSVDVTMRQDKADYIVGVTDDGSGSGIKGRRAVVSVPDGRIVFANSARSLKNVVKDACGAIEKDRLSAVSKQLGTENKTQ